MGRQSAVRTLRRESVGLWMTRDLAMRTGTAIALAAVIAFAVLSGVANAATYTGSSTGYHPCDGSTSMTASGRTAQIGYVANNSLPFGTWIEMKRPRTVMGRTFFKVMDRGGPGFLVDFWSPSCGWMNSWGRRTITIRVVPRSELYRGKPMKGWRVVASKRGGKLVWKP